MGRGKNSVSSNETSRSSEAAQPDHDTALRRDPWRKWFKGQTAIHAPFSGFGVSSAWYSWTSCLYCCTPGSPHSRACRAHDYGIASFENRPYLAFEPISEKEADSHHPRVNAQRDGDFFGGSINTRMALIGCHAITDPSPHGVCCRDQVALTQHGSPMATILRGSGSRAHCSAAL
jgi:hypothetical protein